VDCVAQYLLIVNLGGLILGGKCGFSGRCSCFRAEGGRGSCISRKLDGCWQVDNGAVYGLGGKGVAVKCAGCLGGAMW